MTSAETVFSASDSKKLLDFVNRAPDFGMAIAQSMMSKVNLIPGSNQITHNKNLQPIVNIGDITIAQPIGDVSSLSDAIVNLLPNQLIQDLNPRFQN